MVEAKEFDIWLRSNCEQGKVAHDDDDDGTEKVKDEWAESENACANFVRHPDP